MVKLQGYFNTLFIITLTIAFLIIIRCGTSITTIFVYHFHFILFRQ